MKQLFIEISYLKKYLAKRFFNSYTDNFRNTPYLERKREDKVVNIFFSEMPMHRCLNEKKKLNAATYISIVVVDVATIISVCLTYMKHRVHVATGIFYARVK